MYVLRVTCVDVLSAGHIQFRHVWKGAIHVLRNALGGLEGQMSQKKCFEGVRFNVINITSGGWMSNFQEKSIRQNFDVPYNLSCIVC